MAATSAGARRAPCTPGALPLGCATGRATGRAGGGGAAARWEARSRARQRSDRARARARVMLRRAAAAGARAAACAADAAIGGAHACQAQAQAQAHARACTCGHALASASSSTQPGWRPRAHVGASAHVHPSTHVHGYGGPRRAFTSEAADAGNTETADVRTLAKGGSSTRDGGRVSVRFTRAMQAKLEEIVEELGGVQKDEEPGGGVRDGAEGRMGGRRSRDEVAAERDFFAAVRDAMQIRHGVKLTMRQVEYRMRVLKDPVKYGARTVRWTEESKLDFDSAVAALGGVENAKLSLLYEELRRHGLTYVQVQMHLRALQKASTLGEGADATRVAFTHELKERVNACVEQLGGARDASSADVWEALKAEGVTGDSGGLSLAQIEQWMCRLRDDWYTRGSKPLTAEMRTRLDACIEALGGPEMATPRSLRDEFGKTEEVGTLSYFQLHRYIMSVRKRQPWSPMHAALIDGAIARLGGLGKATPADVSREIEHAATSAGVGGSGDDGVDGRAVPYETVVARVAMLLREGRRSLPRAVGAVRPGPVAQ